MPGAVAGDASFAPGTPCPQAQGGSLQSQGTVHGQHTATSFGGITLPSAAFPISVTSDRDPQEHRPCDANPPGLSSLGKADGLHPGMGSSLPGLAKEPGEFGDTQPRGAQLLWHRGSVLAPGGCVRHVMSNAASPPASPKGRTQITHCIAKEGCSSRNRSGMEQEPCGGKAPCVPSAVPPCPGLHQRWHRPSKLSDGWGPFVAHAGS